MLLTSVLAIFLVAGLSLVVAKARRSSVYAAMGGLDLGAVEASSLRMPVAPDFTRLLYSMPDILAADEWLKITDEARKLVDTERSYLPTHKKGGTVAYETLCAKAPAIVALYRSAAMRELVSRIVGEPVSVTPVHDQSSCSVLFYERPGDHIDWHYDHNFYHGRHFTVLIVLDNLGRSRDGLSAARLLVKDGDGERIVPTPPNTLVAFEGAKVLHKVTPIADGERRTMLSMTFSTDPTNTTFQGVARRMKDMAFFGVRALWT